MSTVSQMLAECLSYESRRRELITRCEQLLERVEHMLTRLYAEVDPADLTKSETISDLIDTDIITDTVTDTLPDLTAIWRQVVQLEWEFLDLRRELEAAP
jgi:hypothetical protein